MKRMTSFICEALSEDGKIAYMDDNVPVKVANVSLMLQYKAQELFDMRHKVIVIKVNVNEDIVVDGHKVDAFDYNGAPDLLNTSFTSTKTLRIDKGEYILLYGTEDDTDKSLILMMVDGEWIVFSEPYSTNIMNVGTILTVIFDPSVKRFDKRLPARPPRLSVESALSLLSVLARESNKSAISGIAVLRHTLNIKMRQSISGYGRAHFTPSFKEFKMGSDAVVHTLAEMECVPYFYSGVASTKQYVIIYSRGCWWLISNEGIPNLEGRDLVKEFLEGSLDTVEMNKERGQLQKLSDKETKDELNKMVDYIRSFGVESIVEYEVGQLITQDVRLRVVTMSDLTDVIGGATTIVHFIPDVSIPYCIINEKVIFLYNGVYYTVRGTEFINLIRYKTVYDHYEAISELQNAIITESYAVIETDPMKVGAMMEVENVRSGKLRTAKDVKVGRGQRAYTIENDTGTDAIVLHTPKTGELIVKGSEFSNIAFMANEAVFSAQQIMRMVTVDLGNHRNNDWKVVEIFEGNTPNQ